MPETKGPSIVSRAIFAGSAVVAIAAIIYATQHRGGAGAPSAAASPGVAAQKSVDDLVEATRRNPGAAAWMALGQRQYDRNDFAAAAESYHRATLAAPGNGEAWSAYGEAQVMASAHDPMPSGALAAFRRAIEINPKDPRGRYFMAVSRDLKGEHRQAIDDWLALLKDTPPGAPWEADLKRTIEQVGKINGIEVTSRIAAIRPAPAMPQFPAGQLTAGQAIPGPTAADLHAAAGMSPDQQQAMVAGMVARLEGRLRTDPANVDGWVMLMRSRMTLGETDKAARALKDAIAANPAAAGRLKAEAGVLGVPAG